MSAPQLIRAFSVAQLTVAVTPSIRLSFLSIRAAQDAQASSSDGEFQLGNGTGR